MAQLSKPTLDDEWVVGPADDDEWIVESAGPASSGQSKPPPDFNDERTASQVAWDGAWNVAKGVPQAITGIPSMVGGGADALWDMLTGQGSGKAQEMLSGAIAPLTTPMRGLGALALPDSVQAPTNTEWEQSQQAAGANLGGIAVGAGLAKLPKVLPTPDALMTRAANNRAPLPPQGHTGRRIGRDVMAAATGGAVGGPVGAIGLPAAIEGVGAIRRSNTYRTGKARVQEALAARMSKGDTAPVVAETPPASPSTPIEGQNLPLPEQGPFAGNMKPPASPPAEIPFEMDSFGKPEIPKNVSYIVKRVEDAIAPTGRDQLTTLRFVPDLLKVAPEVMGQGKGPRFDASLMKAFKRVESNVDAVDGSIPATVNVPKAAVVDGLMEIANDYTQRGLVRTASQIEREAAKFSELPGDAIPWEKFRERKRAFFKENRSSSAPIRRAYGVLMEASSKYSGSEILAQANRDYSIVRRAVDAAKLDLNTGRRIREVGKPAKAPGLGGMQ